LLKALKTPLYLKVERLYKLEQKDKNLDQLNVMEQVTPENGKQEVLLLLHFWRHLHTFYNTVQ
jgi:hypothetical protein